MCACSVIRQTQIAIIRHQQRLAYKSKMLNVENIQLRYKLAQVTNIPKVKNVSLKQVVDYEMRNESYM